MRKIEGLLLDLDGTLIDSNDAHAKAWVEALAESGHPVDYKTVRERIGMGSDNLLPLVAKVQGKSKEAELIDQRRSRIFHDRYMKDIRPFPFAQQLLETLNELGFKLIIASSAAEEDLLALLRQTGLHHLVDGYTSSDDAEFSKPHPDILQAAMEKMQLPISKVIMLGDTPYDIAAAQQLGIDSVAFTCGGWKAEDLRDAKKIYKDPEDLLQDLKKNNAHALEVRGHRGLSQTL